MTTSNGVVGQFRPWTRAFTIAWVVASVCMASTWFGRNVVYADVPAVTDFGQQEVQMTMTKPEPSAKAVFLTFYDDGHGQVEIRSVRNDAMASFAGDHTAWKLDESLRWFVQMPVYVKQVSTQPIPFVEHVAV